MKRSPLKRKKGLNPRSAKRILRDAELDLARSHIEYRSGGLCEARGVVDVEDCSTYGSDAHHLRRRSQGGENTAENLVWICRAHHQWVHANPAAAREAGLLR